MCYYRKHNSDVKTFERPKIDYTIEKYKRKIDYFQKNNTWYSH